LVPEFFRTVFPTGSLTTLSWPLLRSHGLNWHSQGPLKHLKASIDTFMASTDTLTASTDTLSASKALSRPLHSTSTQLACNREFTSISHGTMGTLTAFISTLMASTGIFMNSTTLTWPTLMLMGPCKHSHSSASLIEGFGSGSGSIPLTSGSGSGRVDPDPDLDTDWNESTNVPISKLRIETKPKRFDVFQNLKWNFSIYSKNLGTKPKLFDVFQLLFCKSKTFLFFPKILQQNQNFSMCSNFFLA
jgi:hypothetical protein